MSQGTTGAELIARVQYSYNYGFSTRAKVILTSKYCTAIFNSAGGVTCDPPAEIFLSADPEMTCDRSKISAGNIFGGMLLNKCAPQGGNFELFNHFVTLLSLRRMAM